MGPLLLATTLALHPYDWVRVDDPSHPDADAVSSTGALLLEPPTDGTAWSPEVFAEVQYADELGVAEAVEVVNVDEWHEAGFTGAGVKVAVFDLQWFGFDEADAFFDDYQTHDCYTHPGCESELLPWEPRFAYETGGHGIACAEAVRAMAPDAELHLVRVNGRTTLENAVDWAIRNDIDVVSMSMSFFNSSFYDGSGPVSEEMDKLAAAGILMVNSAGNYGRAHWSGPWVDADRDGRLDFGGDNYLWVYLSRGGGSAYVAWNQYNSCGATDLDAWFTTADGEVVGHADSDQATGQRCQPLERLRGFAEESDWYQLVVEHVSGTEVGVDIDIVASGSTIYGGSAQGAMADPSVHPQVFTVGAVDVVDYLENEPRFYSSQGPTIAGVAKPEVAAPDGYTSRVYGPLGFTGTSASAPVVAGLVAVVMSAEEGRTPREAADLLEAWAWESQAGWEEPDPRWGAGKVRLPSLSAGPLGCAGVGGGGGWLGFVALLSLARRRR